MLTSISAPVLATILILFGIGYTIDYNSASLFLIAFAFRECADCFLSPSLLVPIGSLYACDHYDFQRHLSTHSAPQAPQERRPLEQDGDECINIAVNTWTLAG